MRIIRFQSARRTYLGTPVGDGTAKRLDGGILDTLSDSGEILPIDRLLAPIIPTDILCIGLNYREHARESGSSVPAHPMLFIKSSNTLNDPGGAIPIPLKSQQIDYEAELVIVIGRDACHVPRERALDYVLGYTCGNDVSARDWQRDKALGGGQFARGKSFDGFCPIGPWIVTRDQIDNPNALAIRTTLNGRVMQESTTADMIFDVPALIESLSSTMTVRAGSIIMTGTPHGVGFARTPPVWMRSGDTVEVEIENIGRLVSPVRAEQVSTPKPA
jgi:2-keto-4-pentenoate hydratase/2-oxohepta-3-ene-1,7-dioic acid hydratase in catechol pathway